MKCYYKPPLSIHPSLLKKIEKIKQNCGDEAACLFIQAIKTIKKELTPVKSEGELNAVIKKLNLTDTIIFPLAYKDKGGYRSDNLFFEMSVCHVQNNYYYGRIILCFPYLFKKKETMDELEMFCERASKKVESINNVEIYMATYRG